MNNREAWSHYWQHTEAAGCIGQNGYDSGIVAFWEQAFEAIPAKAKVLDICCGNGFVSRLVQQYAVDYKLYFDVYAVDGANVDQQKWQQDEFLSKVRLTTHTAIEVLPFREQNLDVILGQYAFEYTDIKRSVEEISRVLKIGGKAIFVCHDMQSSSVISANETLKFIQFLIGESGFFAILKKMIRQLCRERKPYRFEPTDKLKQLKKKWDNSIASIQINAKKYSETAELVTNIVSVSAHMLRNQHHFNEQQMLEKVASLEHGVKMHRDRLSLCVGAALSKQKLTNIVTMFKKQGMSLRQEQWIQNAEQQILARAITFAKEAAQ